MAAEALKNKKEERGLREKKIKKENLTQCRTNMFLSIEWSSFSEKKKNSLRDYGFIAQSINKLLTGHQ